MKYFPKNPNYQASLVLIIMAGVLITTALLTNRGDFTSAAVVVSGLVCLLTGIFFAALSGSDPLDLRYLSLFPVQGSINFTRACADLGIQGNACIIPAGRDERPVTMQFLPVADYHGIPLSRESFVTGPDTAGIQMEPSCAPLLRLLREREHLVIPSDLDALKELIRELGEEVLEVADRVRSTQDGESITVRMEGYRLVGGCRAMTLESPRCCTANPCPVCSLFATVFAEGTGNVIQLERCAPDPGQPAVTAVFSVLHE
ncbi:hypothetical protein [Methanoregula sp.]|uniref:hypothetical protein n=1 Tax=Methanoregula sp. TaxID=2052170 RepID=UPI003C722FBE